MRVMNFRAHFAHRLDMWDDDSANIELGGVSV
jgi:hypothetical protein